MAVSRKRLMIPPPPTKKKKQSANTDGGTPAPDARKEISKKPSVRYFELTAKLKGTTKMNKNVYSLPLHVYTRPFYACTVTLSHDRRQMKQIQRYDYLVPRSLVDEAEGENWSNPICVPDRPSEM